HRGNLSRRMRHHVRLPPAETAHVPEKRALLTPSELAPTDLIPRGTLQDRLVEVGDVLGIADALPADLEKPREHVENDERARWSGAVCRRRPARSGRSRRAWRRARRSARSSSRRTPITQDSKSSKRPARPERPGSWADFANACSRPM